MEYSFKIYIYIGSTVKVAMKKTTDLKREIYIYKEKIGIELKKKLRMRKH